MPRVVLVLVLATSLASAQFPLLVPTPQYPTIQSAVTAASPNATIRVAPGTYNENIFITNKHVRLESTGGAAVTTVVGTMSASVLNVRQQNPGGTVIRGFTLTGGLGTLVSGRLEGGGVRAILSDGGNPIFLTTLLVEECVVASNTADHGAGIFISTGNRTSATVRRCRIHNNFGQLGGGVYVQTSHSAAIVDVRDTEIVRNTSTLGAAAYVVLRSPAQFTRCTFADNRALVRGGGFSYSSPLGAPVVVDSILWGNMPDQMDAVGTPPGTFVSYCDVQGGYPGQGNTSAVPLFHDAPAGDYRLTAASPCVDAAGATTDVSRDVEGDVRPFGGVHDLGADELVGLGVCGSGGIGTAAGGPFDVLTVDGNAWLPDRRAKLAVGQPFTIDVLQPPTATVPSRFLIAGIVGLPDANLQAPLPFGLGCLCFPLSVLNPAFPGVFTLTSSYGPIPGQLVPSTPAPWSITVPGVPVPLRLALQGLMDEGPGVVRRTNGIVVEIG